MNMDHVPELWKELRLEFKDNLWKKYEEIYDSLLEEDEPIIRNTIRNRKLNLSETGLPEFERKPEKMLNKSDEIVKKPLKMVNKSEEIVKTKSEKKVKNLKIKKIHCIIC
jgi:hypothetical protein